MFTSLDRLETNKGHLHARKRSNGIPGGISHIKAVREPSHEDEDESMKGNHVSDKGVSTYFGVRSIFISS